MSVTTLRRTLVCLAMIAATTTIGLAVDPTAPPGTGRNRPDVVQAALPSIPSDEEALKVLQQQLAGGWVDQDRPTLERLLAPEWSLVAQEGTILRSLTIIILLSYGRRDLLRM